MNDVRDLPETAWPHASLMRTVELEATGLVALREARESGPLSKATEAVAGCVLGGRVIVTGTGKSGHVCRKIEATLASPGTPAMAAW